LLLFFNYEVKKIVYERKTNWCIYYRF
jgi:hypothetical protein